MSEDIVDTLRGAAELLLSGPEHVQIKSGLLNLHNRADEMRKAADEIVRLRHLVPPIAGTVKATAVDEFPSISLEERVWRLEQWKEGFYDL